jgi:alanine-glyoxylate transaminase/serine-glyoxylate transaminase/serine-pyruvate transaminase
MTTAPKPRIPGRRFLHSPGPTPLPDAVLHAMSVQPMDLGDPRVDANIDAVERGLKRLLQTEASDVFMYAANGHGVWEAAIENLAGPGQALLIAGTGHFSESWALQAEALGRTVVRTPWREGWPIDAAAIEQALRAWADGRGLKPRDAFQPIRIAVTGSKVSPGLFESLELLGKDESLKRLSAVGATV